MIMMKDADGVSRQRTAVTVRCGRKTTPVYSLLTGLALAEARLIHQPRDLRHQPSRGVRHHEPITGQGLSTAVSITWSPKTSTSSCSHT